MIYLQVEKLEIGDSVFLSDILNKKQEWTVVTFPKKSGTQGGLMTCEVRRGVMRKHIYFG